MKLRSLAKLPWLLSVGLAGCTDVATESDTNETADTEVDELQSFEVTGVVTDDDGAPIAGAMVLVGGRQDTMVFTAEDGSYALWFSETGLGEPAVVAAQLGYRSIGREFFKPDTPVDLVLQAVKPPDNIEYSYQDPGNGVDAMKEDCSHCHTSFVLEFLASKHAQATANPLLQDLYAGVTSAYSDEPSCQDAGGQWSPGLEPGSEDSMIDKCYLGGGVLPDLNTTCGGMDQLSCDDSALAASDAPVDYGACADCHAPGIDGVAGGRNLHDAVGLAYDIGVHCDTCHKVRDVDLTLPPGVGQRLVMGRPSEPGRNMFEWEPVYFGPLLDVPNVAMGGSIQPLFDSSLFCAGCHEHEQPALIPEDTLDAGRWPTGLPVHSTYSEWLAGPYNQEATQCQWCHMPANMEATNAVDIATHENQSITFGFPREPDNIRQHLFRGPLHGEPRLIDTALYVSVDLQTEGDELLATISVANIGCGHAIPTGEPMRSLLLLVQAEGDCGLLPASGGMTIPDTGGATLMGVEGTDTTTEADAITWPDAASIVQEGQIVRVVSPTGTYDDYDGIGLFADPELSPEQKGMQIFEPVGQAIVLSIEGDLLTLDQPLDTQTGDLLYLGELWPEEPVDGQAALALAGSPGTAFAKVLLDSDGQRHVPHYKAVDIASDNRIAPGSNALSSHRFELAEDCNAGDVTATVLYRPVPLQLAQERGWDSSDSIIATGQASW